MAKLEDLKPNAAIKGILADTQVTIISAQWHDHDAVELTYKEPNDRVDNTLAFCSNEISYTLVEAGPTLE